MQESTRHKCTVYQHQMRLSAFNLVGELPNFIALLISAIGTKAVLVFVDVVDTGSNILRNFLMLLFSRRIHRDLHGECPCDPHKVEAKVSVVCDTFLLVSLGLMLGVAVHDLIFPRPAEELLLFVTVVKAVNVGFDVLILYKQHKICARSGGMMLKSAHSVAIKNLAFDTVSLAALILMNLFSDVRLLWYLSPVVSILLGGYLVSVTVQRMHASRKQAAN